MAQTLEISTLMQFSWTALRTHRAAAARLVMQAGIVFVPALAVSATAAMMSIESIVASARLGRAPSFGALYAAIYCPLLVLWLVAMPVAVSWYRMILLGEKPQGLMLRLDGHVWSYMKYLLASWACILAFTVPAAAIVVALVRPTGWAVPVTAHPTAMFIAAIAIFAFIYIRVRLWIGSAARACGIKMTLTEAWSLARGHTGTMFIALAAAGLPIGLIQNSVNRFVLPGNLVGTLLVTYVASFVLTLIGQFVANGIMAGAYERLIAGGHEADVDISLQPAAQSA